MLTSFGFGPDGVVSGLATPHDGHTVMVTRRIGTREQTASEPPSSESRSLDSGRASNSGRPEPFDQASTEPISSGRPLGYLRGGRFTLERELGSGGEGVVYLARDRLRRDRVALKMLHLDAGRSLGLLKREFRFLKGLIHPSLVPLYELFADQDEAFFSMAFIEGRHFSEAAARTHPLRPILNQLIDVVSFLHDGGIVHRDIKPTNVLVRPNGRLTLLDFGVALRVHSSAALGPAVGTPEYMAPELLRGLPPTPRSDAYAVGLIVYEAIARIRPNPNLEFPSLREIIPEVPEDLDEFCSAVLEARPERRLTLKEARTLLRASPAIPRIAPAPLTEAPAHAPSLVGRERELLQLETAFHRLKERNEPVLVFISGQSGMGKTALLEELGSLLSPDAIVLLGRCSDSESIRFKALDCIVGPLLEFLRKNPTLASDAFRSITDSDQKALIQLFPEVIEHSPLGAGGENEGSAAPPARTLQSAAARALGQLLGRLAANKPLVLLVDDLQWGDEDSARLLYDVFGSEGAPRCLLVIAYRSDLYAKSRCMLALRQGTDCLEDELDCAEIHLGPLDPNDARALGTMLADGRVPAHKIEAMASNSKGIPLHIIELVGAACAAKAEAEAYLDYDSLLLSRLESLSPTARELFLFVCQSGTLPAERFRALELGRLDEAVSELCTNRLCRTEAGGTTLVPFHDTVRTVAREATQEDLERRHRRLAHIWRKQPADAGRVAAHYLAAGELDLARKWASLAGDEALSKLLVDKAVDFYQIALSCVGNDSSEIHAECEQRLAEALADAGRGAEAAPLLAKLAKDAKPEIKALYRRKAAEQWLASGAISDGVRLLSEVHEEASLSWPSSQNAALMAIVRARASIFLRSVPKALPSSPVSPLKQRQLDVCRTTWTVAHVSPLHGAANSARYLALALKYKSGKDLPYALGMEACYRSLEGTRAALTTERFRERAERLLPGPHQGYDAGFFAFVQGQSRYFLSDVLGARPYFERADRAFSEECTSVAWELAATRLFWATTLTLLGKLRELDRRMRVWLRDAQARQDQYAWVGLQIWNARRIALRDGEAEEALSLVDAATAGWTSPYLGTHAASGHLVAAQTLLIGGRPEHALGQLAQMEREVRPMLRHTQVLRVSWLMVKCSSYLTLALESQEARPYIKALEQIVARLRRENTPIAHAAAKHFGASRDYLLDPNLATLRRLSEAADLYRDVGFEIHAASLDWVVSRLLGGQEGDNLRNAALGVFHRADVDTQGHAARAYAPDLSLTRPRGWVG
jgi:eukaryotic-like serine/threonine-protein kinase